MDSKRSDLLFEYQRLVAAHTYEPPFSVSSPAKEDWGGLNIRTFRPTCRNANLNDYSLVMLFEYESLRLLLCGDNERSSWGSLMQQDSFVSILRKVDIFVASHHGRESGFYGPLFERLRPRLTVISDGPVTDTDVAPRYAEVLKGMEIRYKNGGSEKRRCITTRCDGSILVEFSTELIFPVIRVTVEKGGSGNRSPRLI